MVLRKQILSMTSLPLVLEKTEESRVKIISIKENLPVVLSNFDFGLYESIVVMSLDVD